MVRDDQHRQPTADMPTQHFDKRIYFGFEAWRYVVDRS
jgi:hypothetical protein